MFFPDSCISLVARGRVLGIGSGLNLAFYDPAKVSRVWGLDPSVRMWDLGREQRVARGFDVEFVERSTDAIPLLLEQNGMEIRRLETMYLPGWKIAGFNYWGAAV